ncbi:hypothetical protein HDU77_000309 [Chytriomyces hyalinus]|nr:hypothetical protein HDU77_000309 [Chytriomyces hyalinus]
MHVKVVMLCKGRGADPATYKPDRDESQWWGRRDALARCHAAFLHGPTCADHSKTLVLIHDEDWAVTTTTTATIGSSLPTERNLVSQWKSAAVSSRPGSGSCYIQSHKADTELSADAVSNLDSKRKVLDHLHANCDLEFIRKHNLNSSPEVVLRKKNKKDLVKVWYEWTAQQKSLNKESSQPASLKQSPLEAIFHQQLQPSSPNRRVIAVSLHESFEAELPCFHPFNVSNKANADSSVEFVLFLGAVRDMFPRENDLLRKVCAANKVQLTSMRLGPVAEFTSKILTVVAYHQASGVLGPSLLRLLESKSNSQTSKVRDATPPAKRQKTVASESNLGSLALASQTTMHVMCSVPLHSKELTTDLNVRDSVLWNIIRVTVVTLWRSHIMTSKAELSTKLTLLFQDGLALTLDQSELVTTLAEQHQAAPSEFQILRALVMKRDSVLLQEKEKKGPSLNNWKESADAIIANVKSELNDFHVMEVDQREASADFVEGIYATPEASVGSKTQSLLVLMDIQGPASTSKVSHSALMAACRKLKLNVHKMAILPHTTNILDREAATITMIQHFLYQNRLLSFLSSGSGGGDEKE